MLPLALIVASIPILGQPAVPFVEFDFGPVPVIPSQIGDPPRPVNQIVFIVYAAAGNSYLNQTCYTGLLRIKDVTLDFADSMRDDDGIKAEVLEDGTKLRVYGWMDKKTGKVIAPAIYGEVWTRNLTPAQRPRVKNPPPPPVAFDLKNLPLAPGRAITVSCEVVPFDRNGNPARVEINYEKATDCKELAKDLAERFTKAGLTAEANGNVVQVRGWLKKDGALRPAAGGVATSKELKKEELPTVTGLPRPAPYVEFDFTPIAKAATGQRTAKLVFEVGPYEKDKPFRYERVFDLLSPTGEMATALETRLILDGFKVERVGSKVRVDGWSDERMKFHPATAGKIESADVKETERPTVKNPKAKE